MKCKPYCFLLRDCEWPAMRRHGRVVFARSLVCETCGDAQSIGPSNDRGVNWLEIAEANRRRR